MHLLETLDLAEAATLCRFHCIYLQNKLDTAKQHLVNLR